MLWWIPYPGDPTPSGSICARLFLTVGTAAVLTGCLGGGGYGESVDGQAASGGYGTVTNRGPGAFSQPAPPVADGPSGTPIIRFVDPIGDAHGRRFGLKANVATVADQTATAYLFDLGITSTPLPTENCPDGQGACRQAPSGGSPEISAERLSAVVLYAQTLGVPARVGLDDESEAVTPLRQVAVASRGTVPGIHPLVGALLRGDGSSIRRVRWRPL